MRLIFLRHGNAPKIIGAPDSARILSPLGHEQAKKRGSSIAEILGNKTLNRSLSSPAIRARQTNSDIFDGTGPDDGRIWVVNALIHENTAWTESMDNMFARVGVDDLRTYRGEKEWICFSAWAMHAVKELSGLCDNEPDDANILITGHAPLQNAIVLHLAERLLKEGCQEINRLTLGSSTLLDIICPPLGECEGLIVERNGDIFQVTRLI